MLGYSFRDFFFPEMRTCLFYYDLLQPQVQLEVRNPPANARDLGLIPGSERSPGGGNGNPLMFLPEESHDRGAGGPQSMGLQRVGHG